MSAGPVAGSQPVAGILTGISYMSGIDYYKGVNERFAELVPRDALRPRDRARGDAPVEASQRGERAAVELGAPQHRAQPVAARRKRAPRRDADRRARRRVAEARDVEEQTRGRVRHWHTPVC